MMEWRLRSYSQSSRRRTGGVGGIDDDDVGDSDQHIHLSQVKLHVQ